MAKGLSTTIRLGDNMSSGFTRIINAVNLTISSLEKMSGVDVSIPGIEHIQNELALAGAEVSRFKDTLTKTKEGIGNNSNEQEKWNRSISKGSDLMGDLTNKLKTAFGIYALMNAGKKLISMSDEYVSIDARLNLITENTDQKRNLKNYIYQMAQESRTPMNELSGSVAKLGLLVGNIFSSNKEIVDFSSTLQKAFRISGTGIQESSAAIYQLNQALASGKLQGDEFRSVMENAPIIAQGIAKSMGVGMGELKTLGREGLITSDVIRNAVLGMTDEVNEKFNTLPMTWGDAWTNIKSTAIRNLEPLLIYINKLANSQRIQGFVNGMVSAFNVVGKVGTSVFKGLTKVISFVYDKWGYLEPLVYGIAGAVAYYGVVQGIAALKTMAGAVASGLQTGALVAQMFAEYATIVATEGLVIAQTTLNAAMLAFPGTWIVAGIVAIVIAVGAVTLAIVKWATGTRTWAGVIVGAFYWVGAVIFNVISGVGFFVGNAISMIWNAFAGVANFIGNVLKDPASSFISYVKDMALTALNILKGFAGTVDKVVGTDFAGTIEGWKGNVEGISTNLMGKYGNGKYKEVIKRKTVADFGLDLGRKGLADSFYKGRGKGNEWSDKMKGLKNNSFGMADVLGKDLGGFKVGDTGLGGKGGDVGKNTGKTADNTGKMVNSMEDSEEDLKYLRELAEQEHVNKFTTAEIKVEMNNTNNIEKDMDLNKMIEALASEIETRMTQIAEGVE